MAGTGESCCRKRVNTRSECYRDEGPRHEQVSHVVGKGLTLGVSALGVSIHGRNR